MGLVQFALIALGPLLLGALIALGTWIPAHEAARAIDRDDPRLPRYRFKLLLNLLIAELPFAVMPLFLLIQEWPGANAWEGAEVGANWSLGLVAVATFAQAVALALLGSALLPHLASRHKDLLPGFGAALIPIGVSLVAFLVAFLWIGSSEYHNPLGPFGPEPWRALVFMACAASLIPAAVMAGRQVSEKDAPDWNKVRRPLWIAVALTVAAALLVVQPLYF